MSSITAIQGSDSLTSLFPSRKRARTEDSAYSNPNMGPDTVSFSKDALALLGKTKTAETDPALADSLQTTDTASSEKVSLKDMGKSLFSMMLESLFLADLEENAQASANAAEDGMPREKANPLEDSGKAAEIKKLMNDVASGKADISDLPKAMAAAGGGGSDKQSKSVAAKETIETAEA